MVLDLDTPLSPRTLYTLGDGKVCLDFKYERLPRFCYSCGKMGHFATNSAEIPFDVAKYEEKRTHRFGHWLKAEAKETSPFWEIFYGDNAEVYEEEDIVADTPAPSTQIVLFTGEQPAIDHTTTDSTENRAHSDLTLSGQQGEKQKVAGKCLMSDKGPEKLVLQDDESLSWQKNERPKKVGKTLKCSPAKKVKRYNPYKSISSELLDIDEANYKKLLSDFQMVLWNGLWWIALTSHRFTNEDIVLELSGVGHTIDSPEFASHYGSRKAQFDIVNGDKKSRRCDFSHQKTTEI